MSKKIMLIDGHSILNRAFYGVPDLTNSEGIHTNALYGFLNIMFRFIDEEHPDYLTIAFDMSAPTFRHKAYSDYKGTRKPMAPELKQQVPLIKEILTAMNINIAQMEGFEADDLLGTIAKRSAAQGLDVVIISGDRDLLQLAEEHIMIRIPKTKSGGNEVENYLPDDVVSLYGVTPTEFIDMKALMGDSSDNIPGAPGIGPKTASAIIGKYHTIDEVIAHADEITPPKARTSIKENVDQIKMSRFLAEINIDSPYDFNLGDAEMSDFFNDKSYELFVRFNFKSFLGRFNEGITSKEPDVYESFRLITEKSESDEIFAKALDKVSTGRCIGLNLICDGEYIAGVSICTDSSDVCFIQKQSDVTDKYITDNISKICISAKESDKRLIATINIKDTLPAFCSVCGGNMPEWIDRDIFADVSVAAYLINPTNESYDYDSLSAEYLSIHMKSRQELMGKHSLAELMMIDNDSLSSMACSVSFVSFSAWKVLEDKLKSIDCIELFNNIEMPLTFVLADMELAGVRVDKTGLREYGDKLSVSIDELENEIYEFAGEKFNINSPKQLGVILFEKLAMPAGKKTKSGYSTSADVLEKLAPDYPIVDKILQYRTVSKLKSTYADGLAGYIRDDGRIHCRFNQTITATGRISCTEPNLQNIPIRMELGRQIRKVFIPKDGCILIDADYSQIELRILAHMSGDENLIEAYNSDEDIHRITASQVFNVPLNEVTDQQRRNAKAVNFGIIYGISSFGLSQDLSISKKEADNYIKQYFEAYPSIKSYIDGLVTFAKDRGYSVTMYNRRRPIPELKSSNFMQRSFGERIAMNAPIQGTAADIIKIAMINVADALKNGGYRSKLILQVHDELLVETYKDEIDDVTKIIADGMKSAASLRVPLEIELKQGNDWFEAH